MRLAASHPRPPGPGPPAVDRLVPAVPLPHQSATRQRQRARLPSAHRCRHQRGPPAVAQAPRLPARQRSHLLEGRRCPGPRARQPWLHPGLVRGKCAAENHPAPAPASLPRTLAPVRLLLLGRARPRHQRQRPLAGRELPVRPQRLLHRQPPLPGRARPPPLLAPSRQVLPRWPPGPHPRRRLLALPPRCSAARRCRRWWPPRLRLWPDLTSRPVRRQSPRSPGAAAPAPSPPQWPPPPAPPPMAGPQRLWRQPPRPRGPRCPPPHTRRTRTTSSSPPARHSARGTRCETSCRTRHSPPSWSRPPCVPWCTWARRSAACGGSC
mmetsp:Transcript_7534/g.20586  ORF Transcript_7534/g.20586 Transcript_7534/m.20586 type:complete len:323 (-) Transcript_7534:1379-2347(-)